MSTDSTAAVSAAELRRRVRAVEATAARTRESAAAAVLATREAAAQAARVKDEADVAAREAAAAALRLFGNDAELLAGLLDVPAEDLERDAKAVTAARAREVIESLRARAERPRLDRRTRRPAGADAPAPPSTPASAPDGGLADVG